MLADETIARIAADVSAVSGIAGVLLGGSRARGDALPTSDVDLGVYYSPGLADALVAGVWEAAFLVGLAERACRAATKTYVLQCLTRALLLRAHGLHAAAGRWVTNEKGLVPAVASLPRAPAAFVERADTALTRDLASAVGDVGVLVAETRALLGPAV